jgi:hypothetical protein
VTRFVGNLRRHEIETATNSRNIRRQSIREDVALAVPIANQIRMY